MPFRPTVLPVASFGRSQPRSLPRIVGTFKAAVTRRSSRPVWQRNYYEHIIRDQQTLRGIRHYIETNPDRHDE
jgi:REP element-mobilizing transposase RayT